MKLSKFSEISEDYRTLHKIVVHTYSKTKCTKKLHCLLRKNSLLKKVLMAVMKSAPSTELPVLGLALSFNFKPRFSLHTEDQNRPNFYEFCLKIFIPDILKVKKMGLVETD